MNINITDLWHKFTDSLKGTNLTDDEKEAILIERADKLEKLAKHYETEAALRKRIATAEKRIKAIKPSSGLGGISIGSGTRGGLIKVIVVLTIVAVIIVVIMSKAC